MKNTLTSFSTIAKKYVAPLKRYRVLLAILAVLGLYAYIVLQINTATSVSPSKETSVSAVKTPRLDTDLVDQLKQLEDNSVTVRTLFNEARTNPFQ